MTYLRNTRHDYEDFLPEIQEYYLNLRYQYGYHYAGRWLKTQAAVKGFAGVIFSLAMASIEIDIVCESLKKSGLLK